VPLAKVQLAAVEAAGLAASDPLEAAQFATLPPGAYTAVIEPGAGGLNTEYDGTALFEVYDVDQNPLSNGKETFWPVAGSG
jgi:hypothetical protein